MELWITKVKVMGLAMMIKSIVKDIVLRIATSSQKVLFSDMYTQLLPNAHQVIEPSPIDVQG